jgi:hypothetical protein
MIPWMRRRIRRSRARCHKAGRAYQQMYESRRTVFPMVESDESWTHRRGAEGAEEGQRVGT